MVERMGSDLKRIGYSEHESGVLVRVDKKANLKSNERQRLRAAKKGVADNSDYQQDLSKFLGNPKRKTELEQAIRDVQAQGLEVKKLSIGGFRVELQNLKAQIQSTETPVTSDILDTPQQAPARTPQRPTERISTRPANAPATLPEIKNQRPVTKPIETRQQIRQTQEVKPVQTKETLPTESIAVQTTSPLESVPSPTSEQLTSDVNIFKGVDNYEHYFSKNSYLNEGAKVKLLNVRKEKTRQTNKAYADILSGYDDEGKDLKVKDVRSINRGNAKGVSDTIIIPILSSPELRAKYIVNGKFVVTKDIFDQQPLLKDASGNSGKYETKGILNFSERKRIVKVLNAINASDAEKLANLFEAQIDPKSVFNSEKLLPYIQSNELRAYLCDYNGDGLLNDNDKQKDRTKAGKFISAITGRDKFAYGDQGSTFGAQLYRHLEVAGGLDKQGNVVDKAKNQDMIKNVVKLVDANYTSQNPAINAEFKKFQDNPEYCTAENMLALLKKNPELRDYFIKAIQNFTGNYEHISNNLEDVLVGDVDKNLIESYKEEDEQQKMFDTFRNDPANKEYINSLEKQIGKDGMVDFKRSAFLKIMNVADVIHKVMMADMGNELGKAFGIDAQVLIKERKRLASEVSYSGHELRNYVIQKTYQSIVKFGGFGIDGKIIPHIGFGGKRVGELGKSKGNWGVQLGMGADIKDGSFMLAVAANAEQQFQINHKRVLSAKLTDPRGAKYVGVDATGAIALTGTVIGTAGMSFENDPKMGIEQISKHYREISDKVFQLKDNVSKNLSSLKSKEEVSKAIEQNFRDNITIYARDPLYKRFFEDNKAVIEGNVKVMMSYLDAYHVIDNILQFTEADKRTSAMQDFVRDLSKGMVDNRRSEHINRLHGKAALTKVGAGVVAVWQPGVPPVLAPYISARLSTREAKYIPNGKRTEYIKQRVMDGKALRSVDLGAGATLEQYANTMKSTYRIEGLDIQSINGKLVLSMSANNPKKYRGLTDANGSPLEIYIHPNTPNVSYENGKLVIGDVKDISYTSITQASGQKNYLILGGTGIAGATKLNGTESIGSSANIAPIETNIETLKYTDYNNKELFKTDLLDKEIQPPLDEAKKQKILNTIFGENGKVKDQTIVDTIMQSARLESGKITITENLAGEFKIEALTTGQPMLSLTYKKETALANAGDRGSRNSIEGGTNALNVLPEGLVAVEGIINGLEKNDDSMLAISKAPDLHINEFKKFMSLAGRTSDNHQIDRADYDLAKVELKKMLPQTAEFKTIIAKIDDVNITSEELAHIINRFRLLFAITETNSKKIIDNVDGKIENNFGNLKKRVEKYLSTNPDKAKREAKITKLFEDPTKYYEKRTKEIKPLFGGKKTQLYRMLEPVKDIVEGRKKFFWENVNKGMAVELDKETFSTYEDGLNNEFKNTPSWSRMPLNNVIGYTAFYRVDDYKDMAIAPATKVTAVDGQFRTLEKNHEGHAKAWMKEKLKKNIIEQNIIIDQVNAKIKSTGIELPKDTKGLQQLFDLMDGKEIEQGDTKISLTTSMIWYLTGECCNQGVGMQILDVKVQKKGKGAKEEVYNGSIANCGDKITSTTMNANFSARMFDMSYRVDAQEKSITLGVAGLPSKKKEQGKIDSNMGDHSGQPDVEAVQDGV